MTVCKLDVCYALCDLVMEQVLVTSPCPSLLHYEVPDIKCRIVPINRQSLINSKTCSSSSSIHLLIPSPPQGFSLWSIRLLCCTVKIAIVRGFTEQCHKGFKLSADKNLYCVEIGIKLPKNDETRHLHAIILCVNKRIKRQQRTQLSCACACSRDKHHPCDCEKKRFKSNTKRRPGWLLTEVWKTVWKGTNKPVRSFGNEKWTNTFVRRSSKWSEEAIWRRSFKQQQDFCVNQLPQWLFVRLINIRVFRRSPFPGTDLIVAMLNSVKMARSLSSINVASYYRSKVTTNHWQ